jgi:hypothetical protein
MGGLSCKIKGGVQSSCNPAFFALSASPLFLSINPRNLSEPTFSVRLSLLLLLFIIPSLSRSLYRPLSLAPFLCPVIFLSLFAPFLFLLPLGACPPLLYLDVRRQLLPRAFAANPNFVSPLPIYLFSTATSSAHPLTLPPSPISLSQTWLLPSTPTPTMTESINLPGPPPTRFSLS